MSTSHGLELLMDDSRQNRYVLVGSMARAAILDDASFFEPSNMLNRDIELIDTRGEFRKYYEFNDTGPIDIRMTRTLRPNLQTTKWILYNGFYPDNPPIMELPQELISVHRVSLPVGETKITTFNTCTQIAMQNIGRVLLGPNRKHQDQFDALREHNSHVSSECSCEKWTETMDEFNYRLRESYEPSPSNKAYQIVRKGVQHLAPKTYRSLRCGPLGKTVRVVQGVENDMLGKQYSIADSSLLHA